MDFIDLSAELRQTISPLQAWHYKIVPKSADENLRTFYMASVPTAPDIKQELEILLGCEVELVLFDEEIISRTLNKYYYKENDVTIKFASEDFLPQIIYEARQLKSSDIHIEIYEQRCRIRFRIDGMLVERYVLRKEEYPALVNKIKISAYLDIAEKRLPQDGRINYTGDVGKFDIRVSVIPTLYGEKVVLRLLQTDAASIDIETLGFSTIDLHNYLEGTKKPSGMMLISGPTGSGKTTTLYATIKLLNRNSRNILTIEDPIEYTLEGVNQVQLRENIGLDFSSSLRTFLRQDPDIIMVGEIRDQATAQMAVRASLTGHLVLSTIHTNSAWGSVSRLFDLGVPPFLVSSTLNTSVAQRLVRKLCEKCKVQRPFSDTLYPKSFKSPKDVKNHFVAKGCSECFFTGYSGRRAIYEVIPIDSLIADKIKNLQMDISNELTERNIKTLQQNAFELFEKGDTSIEEVYPLLY